MSTIPPVSHNVLPTLPNEQETVSTLPSRTQAPPEQTHYHIGMHGRDFGRLKTLLAASLEDEDLTQKKRRRGGFPKMLLRHKRRGKGHPAAVDGRYRRVFPWRDQKDQLYVYPELADPADKTKVDPRLRLLTVAIAQGDTGQIRRDIEQGLFPEKLANGQKLDEQECNAVNQRYNMLLASLYTSLEKVMRGEEPVPPEEVYVRPLEAGDLAAGEAALKGQYGLFNRKNVHGKWRAISEGMHLCFFSGFTCRNAMEYQAEWKRYSHDEVASYALTIGEGGFPCVSPYGGGDLGQFANSALTKDGRGRLIEDAMRTNTRFACVEATFEDNRPDRGGRHLVYPVVFLYMLAAPKTNSAEEREARIWYGQSYWDSFDNN